ncbi:MAG: MunI family type II restriction endonuclease [Bdellovibrionales bacterium]|nr:MunI family type II restriction endonuclease [Bdellovibrionales bacterium]
MGKKALKSRFNWQRSSSKKAKRSEDVFFKVFDEYFKGKKFSIKSKPKELSKIYVNVKISKNLSKNIYKAITTHGISPDYSIVNNKTKKILYIELKTDGVEGKKRSAGNAHERFCKYFTPGLLEILKKKSRIKKSLPFWIVFQI